MNMLRYDPWYLLNDFQREIGRALNRRDPHDKEACDTACFSNFTPEVDIQDNDKEYVLHANVPGVKPENLHVSLEDGVLSLKGEVGADHCEEGKNYIRTERSRGSFTRAFSLPDAVVDEDINASYKQGVLTVTVPKREEQKAKRIDVKVE